MKRLDHTNVLRVMAHPANRGGWAMAAGPDEPSHYFRITSGISEKHELLAMVSLCGMAEGEGKESELDECDPLAPENCKECRRVLLQQRGMI